MVPYIMGNETYYMSDKLADKLSECDAKVQEYYDYIEYTRVPPWNEVSIRRVFEDFSNLEEFLSGDIR